MKKVILLLAMLAFTFQSNAQTEGTQIGVSYSFDDVIGLVVEYTQPKSSLGMMIYTTTDRTPGGGVEFDYYVLGLRGGVGITDGLHFIGELGLETYTVKLSNVTISDNDLFAGALFKYRIDPSVSISAGYNTVGFSTGLYFTL